MCGQINTWCGAKYKVRTNHSFFFYSLSFSFAFMVVDFDSGDSLRFFLTSQNGCVLVRTGHILFHGS